MKNDTSISSACAYSNGNITDPKKDLEGIYFISLIPTYLVSTYKNVFYLPNICKIENIFIIVFIHMVVCTFPFCSLLNISFICMFYY